MLSPSLSFFIPRRTDFFFICCHCSCCWCCYFLIFVVLRAFLCCAILHECREKYGEICFLSSFFFLSLCLHLTLQLFVCLLAILYSYIIALLYINMCLSTQWWSVIYKAYASCRMFMFIYTYPYSYINVCIWVNARWASDVVLGRWQG